MKKNLLLMLVAMTTCITGYAQEVMKVELKNGNVVTYKVEDVNRFYFTTEVIEDEIAPNCSINVVDSLVFTEEAAFKFDYGPEVNYVKAKLFYSYVITDDVSDAQLATELESALSYDSSKPIIAWTSFNEGTSYTLVYAGYNANGKRGNIYRLTFTTRISMNEEIISVQEVTPLDQAFTFKIDIDNAKVYKYYVLYEVGNNLGRFDNKAVFAMGWRDFIATNPHEDEYFAGNNFTVNRSSNDTQLLLYTWAVNYEQEFYHRIFEGFYDINRPNGSRSHTQIKPENMIGVCYKEADIIDSIKRMQIKIVRN